MSNEAVRTWRLDSLFFYINSATLDVWYILVMSILNLRRSLAAIGSLLLDLGKLAFGSLILGSVLRGGFDPFQTFLFGAGVAMVFFAVGILLITKYKE